MELKGRITEYTVSHGFDVHRGGDRTNHFVSVKLMCEEGIPPEDFPLAQLQAKLMAAKACVHDALLSGSVSVDEANDRIEVLNGNFGALAAKLSKKAVG